MDREKVSYMFLVPSMLNALVRFAEAKSIDLPSRKVIQIRGAPIADETVLLGREMFGDALYQDLFWNRSRNVYTKFSKNLQN